MHAAGFMSESAEDQSTALYNGYYEVSATTPSPFSTTTLTAGQYQAIQDELNRQKTKVCFKLLAYIVLYQNSFYYDI